jgi:hypothetical protein
MTDWALENLSTIVHRAVDGFPDTHQGWAQTLGWPVEQVQANPDHARALVTAAMARNAITDHLSRRAAGGGARPGAWGGGPQADAPNDGRNAFGAGSATGMDAAAAALRWRAAQGPEGADLIGQLPEAQRARATDFVNRAVAEAGAPQRATRAVVAATERSAQAQRALESGGESASGAMAAPTASTVNAAVIGSGGTANVPPGVFIMPDPKPHKGPPPQPALIEADDWARMRTPFQSMDEAAAALANMADKYHAKKEWSAIFVQDDLGFVHIGGLRFDGSDRSGDVAFDAVPRGTKLVGFWHLHPTDSLTADQFSETDYETAYENQTRGASGNGPLPALRAYVTNSSRNNKEKQLRTYVLPGELIRLKDWPKSSIEELYSDGDGKMKTGARHNVPIDMTHLPEYMLENPTAFRFRVFNRSFTDPRHIKDRKVISGKPVYLPLAVDQLLTDNLPDVAKLRLN